MKKMSRAIYGTVLAFMLIFLGISPGESMTGQALDLNGAWFSCEFSHSQIPPDDDCKMLDDDGFLIAGTTINHIKVRDSEETACRQDRKGNCFRRNQPRVVVERNSTGAFLPTADGFKIEYWGCSQGYRLHPRGDYYEITPVDDLCYWTSDKRYFLARYTGSLEIVEEKTLFSSER